VAVLVLGYSGYYLCRSNLSVALPLVAAEMAARGSDLESARVALGGVVSAGVLAYAVGKFLSGGVTEWMGGRRGFLAGMLGSALCTVAFALGGTLPFFSLAWSANRLVQSLGWVGMVKIVSRWFPWSRYGGVMGVVSLSYLFGDAAARQAMGLLIDLGVGWRGVFHAAAGSLLGILVVSALVLRESPRQIGEAEPEEGARGLVAGDPDGPRRLAGILLPLLRSRAFLLVCVLSLGVTLLRESFNTWTPTYFTSALGLAPGAAAARSALFPLLGGVSVLLCGFAGDRVGRGGRALVIVLGLGGAALALAALAARPEGGPAGPAVALVALVAFLLIGPYSYLAGAIALDLGGKRASALACGIIDGVGYLAGVLAGAGIAGASVAWGWGGAFALLAGVALATTLVAVLFLLQERG
jgi:OPA family glycerol-3-phosphate transporter-like MFS transporter